MQIDRTNGLVVLPNGYAVTPDLTQDAFRSGAMFAQSHARDFGTLPWIHYDFSGGRVQEKEILASLCFYDQMLVGLTLTADLYPPGPKDWSSYSLDAEAATKQFHDDLLKGMLGKPTKTDRLSAGKPTGSQTTLARPNYWRFSWGTILSGHDFKGGGTSITVHYGNRFEEASKAYRSRQPESV